MVVAIKIMHLINFNYSVIVKKQPFPKSCVKYKP